MSPLSFVFFCTDCECVFFLYSTFYYRAVYITYRDNKKAFNLFPATTIGGSTRDCSTFGIVGIDLKAVPMYCTARVNESKKREVEQSRHNKLSADLPQYNGNMWKPLRGAGFDPAALGLQIPRSDFFYVAWLNHCPNGAWMGECRWYVGSRWEDFVRLQVAWLIRLVERRTYYPKVAGLNPAPRRGFSQVSKVLWYVGGWFVISWLSR